MSVVWNGCYDDSWKSLIDDEAFAHPAKFSRGLIRRIYEHCLSRGYLAAGSVCVDPFGGVALGAMDAMDLGITWVGCELEPKFQALGERNIARWLRFHPVGQARLVCGDSRRLCEVLGPVLADCVVSSPPFCGEQTGGGIAAAMRGEKYDLTAAMPGQNCGYQNQAASKGNLAAMPAGSVDAAVDCIVSSPPYEGSLECHENALAQIQERLRDKGVQRHESAILRQTPDGCMSGFQRYTEASGSLGNEKGDTFWTAAREIVAQCHAILRPGGVCVWVVKAFCRNGAIVDFPGDWQRLNVACGFESLEEIHASLVKTDEHPGLFGEAVVRTRSRKSFFRRLHEKKRPDLAIDYEVVLILRKPAEIATKRQAELFEEDAR